MHLSENTTVHYVAVPTTEGAKPKIVKDVKVVEVMGPNVARVQLGEKDFAIAAFSADKTVPNSFHFADASEPADATQTVPTSAKPPTDAASNGAKAK